MGKYGIKEKNIIGGRVAANNVLKVYNKTGHSPTGMACNLFGIFYLLESIQVVLFVEVLAFAVDDNN